MACIGRYRADDVLLYLGVGHRLQITGSDRQFDPMGVIACTDYEQHLVVPCEPIQQAGEGAESLVEWTIPDPDRQVDDGDARGWRRSFAFFPEQLANRPMDQIDDERIFGNRLVVVSPVSPIRTEDRANVQRALAIVGLRRSPDRRARSVKPIAVPWRRRSGG